MNCEIERKFLLKDDSWKNFVQKRTRIVQGYARTTGALGTIRFRIVDDCKGFLTLKGVAHGCARSEFEYELPLNDIRAMLAEFGENATIEKVRHAVPAGDLTWEIDEFLGENAGLAVAEIELPRPDAPFEKPAWLGEEVTGDPRYGNGFLSVHPFRSWKK